MRELRELHLRSLFIHILQALRLLEKLDVQKKADAASAEEALNIGETAVNGKVLK